MIERLRTLQLSGRHPRARMLSRYLDDELDGRKRQSLEAHVRDCERCQRLLASLRDTVGALGSIADAPPTTIADSIIAAVRADDPPALAVVPDSGGQPLRASTRWRGRVGAAVRYCLSQPRLRVTLPITIATGVALSLVNMGGSLLHGNIDVGVCLMCAADFLVPFLALNLMLLVMLRSPRRGRPPAGPAL